MKNLQRVKNVIFQPPQPADSWEGMRHAVFEGPICPQVEEFTRNTQGEEDCLYLNVYTPKVSPVYTLKENSVYTPNANSVKILTQNVQGISGLSSQTENLN